MSRATPGSGLLHPAALAAIALLVLNDHLLKPHFANALTGKLSDVAGLVFFPLLLQALWELAQRGLGRSGGPSRAALGGATVVTGLVFAAVQLWPPATDAYRWIWGALYWPLATVGNLLDGSGFAAFRPAQVWPDPTDLLALPALAAAWWAGSARAR